MYNYIFIFADNRSCLLNGLLLLGIESIEPV